MIKVIVDCFGADNSPINQVLGAVEAVNAKADLSVVLVGKSQQIINELDKYEFDEDRVEVLNADDEITCNDKPTTAIKDKTNSSLVEAIELLNSTENSALVSAGSTGAILTGAVLKIGRIKGVSRPALAPLLPTIGEKGVMLVDCGANADCKPINLLHFAIMGSVYNREVLGIKNPRLAILSNGTENEKGNELTKEAFQLIKNLPNIDFKGNVEARDIFSCNYDLVVCDGFSGNIALKSAEGTMKLALKTIKQNIMTSIFAKLGYLMQKKQFKAVKNKLDYNNMGGAVFLGVKKPVIKAHGASSSTSIKLSILQAYSMINNNVINKISEGVSALALETKHDDEE